MNCPECHGRGRVHCCPPGWPCFETIQCPKCEGRGKLHCCEGDRPGVEDEVARMIDEGCPNVGEPH